MAGGSASALSLSRPAQASLTLRPIGSLSRPRRPLSRGSSPAGYPAEPLVSYRINRQLSGWNLPPQMIRAFGAHGQTGTSPFLRVHGGPALLETVIQKPRSMAVSRWISSVASASASLSARASARSVFTSSEVALRCRVAGQSPLAGLQELLRPAVIHALCDSLLAAELGDAGLAAQSFQHNADLLFGLLPPCRSADVTDCLLGANGSHGSCSHRDLLRRYDEPELLPHAIRSICPVSPDGGHSAF
jgi:hypothetical protein